MTIVPSTKLKCIFLKGEIGNMDIVLLGKVVKAMYKLSGKTLTQLSEETELSVDTINNFFYARLQKPSYFGVSSLVRATGYTMSELDGFMNYAKQLPTDADIVEEFTKYIFTVKDTDASVVVTNTIKNTGAAVNSAVDITAAADNAVPGQKNLSLAEMQEAEELHILRINEQYEKQLDRFKATHLNYVEQLKISYQQQILLLEESGRDMKEHFDRSISGIQNSHATELKRVENEVKNLRKLNYMLIITIITEAVVMALITFLLR